MLYDEYSLSNRQSFDFPKRLSYLTLISLQLAVLLQWSWAITFMDNSHDLASSINLPPALGHFFRLTDRHWMASEIAMHTIILSGWILPKVLEEPDHR